MALALVAFAQPLEERAKAWFAPNRRNEPNAPGVTFESQLGVKQESNLIDVTLYFRYGDTNLLGAVGAQLDMRRGGNGRPEHRGGAAGGAGCGCTID